MPRIPYVWEGATPNRYPMAQGGYSLFGITRNPQDQPAIDAMAGDLLSKRQLNNISAFLGKDISSLAFDSDEMAQLMSHPSAVPTPGTKLPRPSDSNMTKPVMFYQYAMTADYALAWIRNLSSRVDSIAGTADAASVGDMAKLILRPDFGEWSWSGFAHAHGGAPTQVATQIGNTNALLRDDHAPLSSLEADPTRKANYFRLSDSVGNFNSAELFEHDLIFDIMIMALGFCRLPITTVNGTVRDSVRKISSDPRALQVPINAAARPAERCELMDQLIDFDTWANQRYTHNINVKANGQAVAAVQDEFFSVYKAMRDSASTSGLRDYIGGKYADLMQKFWVAVKTSGLVMGDTPFTWAQSLDTGPLLGRRFHSCAPGQIPTFVNQYGETIPPSEAITWRQGRPFLNEGVVDMSRGGCGPAIGADIDPGPLSVYGADLFSYKGRENLPFNARAALLKDLSGYSKSQTKSKQTNHASRGRKRKVAHRKKRKHARKPRRK